MVHRRQMVSKEDFQRHFWTLLKRFNDLATPEVGVPGYFRFLTILGATCCAVM